jgi:ATP/maltotriose-dependent transcriptional regulator MalT
LARSCIPAARYDEAIELSEPLMTHGDPDVAMHAAFVCGTAYSLLGEQLTRAQACLAVAESFCHAHHNDEFLPRIIFEQAGILAQQGQLADAVARYRDALFAAEQSPSANGHTWRILAHNNLAYHLHLLGDHHEAQRHVRLGFRFAERFGQRMSKSYLHSTSGEIALAHGEITTAEQQFRDGLVIAEHYGMQERIAGLTATLGLVALARGEADIARVLFTQALQQADALGVHHLATQIRIWLIPLLPVSQARQRFQEAQTLAQHSGRTHLLQQLNALPALD